MRVMIKIILSVVIFLVAIFFLEMVRSGMGTKHSTGGIGPFIVYPALLVGWIAIWRWKPESEKENDKSSNYDNEVLKKD